MAYWQVVLVHVMVAGKVVCGQSWTCSRGLSSVQTFLEVETSRVVGSELVHAIVEDLWNASMAKKQEAHVEYREQGDVHVFSADVGRLQVQKKEEIMQIEVSTCKASWSPPLSYKMALSVQHVIQGGTWKWSVAVSPPPIDSDLDHYFKSMANISDEKHMIASYTSNLSSVEIWRINGATSMLLNNVIMSDTRDEALYHEMLVHPALFAAASPQRVLIIGGGEGAALREVLKNRHVKNATMVDIDEALVALCREHLPMMHQGSFSSENVSLVFQDGIQYLQGVSPGTYDVVIVDGIDVSEFYDEDTCVAVDNCKHEQGQVHYGDVLFTTEFYRYAHDALRSGGAFVQYISAVEEEDCKDRLQEAGFDESVVYSVGIESFHGSGARFALAVKDTKEPITKRISSALMHTDVGLQHLDASLFHKSLDSERQWRRLKGGGGGGGGGGRGRGRGGGRGGHGSCDLGYGPHGGCWDSVVLILVLVVVLPNVVIAVFCCFLVLWRKNRAEEPETKAAWGEPQVDIGLQSQTGADSDHKESAWDEPQQEFGLQSQKGANADHKESAWDEPQQEFGLQSQEGADSDHKEDLEAIPVSG